MSKRPAPLRLDPRLLAECLDYDPETGALTWRRRPVSHFASARAWSVNNAKLAGIRAGSISENGYLALHLNGRKLYGQRVAWAIHHCADVPAGHRVHLIGTARDDIRIANLELREVRA